MSGKKIKLNPEAMEAVQGLMKAFKEKFGREPGPDDPLLFDPDADTPQPMPEGKMESMMGDIANAAGLSPDLAYAIRKTGLLVTQRNKDKLSDEQIAAWNEALAEYEMLHKRHPFSRGPERVQ
jgi:hypothetical protein